MRNKGDKGAPSEQDFVNAAKNYTKQLKLLLKGSQNPLYHRRHTEDSAQLILTTILSNNLMFH